MSTESAGVERGTLFKHDTDCSWIVPGWFLAIVEVNLEHAEGWQSTADYRGTIAITKIH